MFLRWIIHWIKAGHRKGRGIHAPYACYVVRNALYGEEIGGTDRLETLRKQLLQNREVINVQDAGAGSRRMSQSRRTIGAITRHTGIRPSRGRLLARLVALLQPDEIIELGTGMGLSCMYMAAAHSAALVHSCEADPSIAGLARRNAQRAGLDNIRVHHAVFEPWLESMLNQNRDALFVHIDGDHRGRQLELYVSRILAVHASRVVLVLDDIHWSAGIYAAWKRILERPGNRLGLELWNTGILIFEPGIQRDHFVLKFF